MTRYRSAWADPEHVRLAMNRSWWDESTTERGPFPVTSDQFPGFPPATTASEPQEQVGKRGYPRHDDYAAHRCGCGHICYANQQPGDSCLVCPCADHRPAGAS